jgi:hypothetical protein
VPAQANLLQCADQSRARHVQSIYRSLLTFPVFGLAIKSRQWCCRREQAKAPDLRGRDLRLGPAESGRIDSFLLGVMSRLQQIKLGRTELYSTTHIPRESEH